MKKHLKILFIALVLIIPSLVNGADIEVVPSEGTALKSDDIADVKRRAIDHALKNAVSDAAKAILTKESLSANDPVMQALTSEARRFVLNYKIRSEGWVNHMDMPPSGAMPEGVTAAGGVELYHIWVDASVDNGALRQAIGKYLSVESFSAPLVINIMDVRDYTVFKGLLASLRKITVIKDISYNSFSNGRITLLARASGEPSTLAGRIARELPQDFTVTEGAGQIIIRPSEGLATE